MVFLAESPCRLSKSIDPLNDESFFAAIDTDLFRNSGFSNLSSKLEGTPQKPLTQREDFTPATQTATAIPCSHTLFRDNHSRDPPGGGQRARWSSICKDTPVSIAPSEVSVARSNLSMPRWVRSTRSSEARTRRPSTARPAVNKRLRKKYKSSWRKFQAAQRQDSRQCQADINAFEKRFGYNEEDSSPNELNIQDRNLIHPQPEHKVDQPFGVSATPYTYRSPITRTVTPSKKIHCPNYVLSKNVKKREYSPGQDVSCWPQAQGTRKTRSCSPSNVSSLEHISNLRSNSACSFSRKSFSNMSLWNGKAELRTKNLNKESKSSLQYTSNFISFNPPRPQTVPGNTTAMHKHIAANHNFRSSFRALVITPTKKQECKENKQCSFSQKVSPKSLSVCKNLPLRTSPKQSNFLPVLPERWYSTPTLSRGKPSVSFLQHQNKKCALPPIKIETKQIDEYSENCIGNVRERLVDRFRHSTEQTAGTPPQENDCTKSNITRHRQFKWPAQDKTHFGVGTNQPKDQTEKENEPPHSNSVIWEENVIDFEAKDSSVAYDYAPELKKAWKPVEQDSPTGTLGLDCEMEDEWSSITKSIYSTIAKMKLDSLKWSKRRQNPMHSKLGMVPNTQSTGLKKPKHFLFLKDTVSNYKPFRFKKDKWKNGGSNNPQNLEHVTPRDLRCKWHVNNKRKIPVLKLPALKSVEKVIMPLRTPSVARKMIDCNVGSPFQTATSHKKKWNRKSYRSGICSRPYTACSRGSHIFSKQNFLQPPQLKSRRKTPLEGGASKRYASFTESSRNKRTSRERAATRAKLNSGKRNRNPYKPASSYLDLAMRKQRGSARHEEVRPKKLKPLTSLPIKRPRIHVSTPVTKAPPLIGARRINRSRRRNYRKLSETLSSTGNLSSRKETKYSSCPPSLDASYGVIPSHVNSFRKHSSEATVWTRSISTMHPTPTSCRKATLGRPYSGYDPATVEEPQSRADRAQVNGWARGRNTNTSQFSTPISHVVHKSQEESRSHSHVVDLQSDDRSRSQMVVQQSEDGPQGKGITYRNFSQNKGSNRAFTPLISNNCTKVDNRFLQHKIKIGARLRKASFVRSRPTFNRRCRR